MNAVGKTLKSRVLFLPISLFNHPSMANREETNKQKESRKKQNYIETCKRKETNCIFVLLKSIIARQEVSDTTKALHDSNFCSAETQIKIKME